MPIHDWTRVDAGLFHDFHQRWVVRLCNVRNAGMLPNNHFALVEQNIRAPIPNVLTLSLKGGHDKPEDDTGAIAVETRPPRTRLTRRSEIDSYVRKASGVTVRNRHGDIVAVVEVVSPGNKASRSEFRALIQKSAELIRQGVNLKVVDLFPPGKRDPQGIHKALWDEFEEEDLELPQDKPLTLASYDAGSDPVAYVEFVAVGDLLPEMPLFLKPNLYVPAPLETAYQPAWHGFPGALKGLLDRTA